MAINIDTFKRFVESVANKNGKGTVKPSDFNLYAERALMEWTAKQYGNEEEYQVGRPIPRYAYESTLNITDNLRHLKEVREFIVDSAGKIKIPDGVSVKDRLGSLCPKYMNFSSLRTKYMVYSGTTDKDICGYKPESKETRELITYEKDAKVYRDDEIGKLLSSTIRYPSVEYPACTLYSEDIQMFPKSGLQYVTLTYLRQPNTPVWAYTVQNGRPVYDANNSIDLDAPEKAFNKIAMGVLSFLGINIREQELIQYAEGKKQSGV